MRYSQLLQLEPAGDLKNLEWMLKLTENWVEQDLKVLCSHVFPTYRAVHQFRPKSDRYFKSFSSQLDDTLDLLLSQR